MLTNQTWSCLPMTKKGMVTRVESAVWSTSTPIWWTILWSWFSWFTPPRRHPPRPTTCAHLRSWLMCREESLPFVGTVWGVGSLWQLPCACKPPPTVLRSWCCSLHSCRLTCLSALGSPLSVWWRASRRSETWTCRRCWCQNSKASTVVTVVDGGCGG